MEFDVNSLVEKTKETIELIADTTVKAACIQKMKFDIATIKNKLNKCYKELGKAYFESTESEEANEKVSIAIEKVKEVLAELEAAKAELEKEKEA